MENPFLSFAQNLESLPNFDQMHPQLATEAIDFLLNQTQNTLNNLLKQPATWEDFARPYFAALEELNAAWGILSHLHNVAESEECRAVFHQNLPKISAFFSALAQNEKFANAWKNLKESKDFQTLTPPRQKITQEEWRDYQLGGAFLDEKNKARFKELEEELAQLSARFAENVLDSTNDFSLMVKEEELIGVPKALYQNWQSGETYRLTLQMPCYLPVMQHAHNRELRQKLYTAYVQRASNFTPRFDNSQNIQDILKKRKEEAQILGFAHFADLSAFTKMAGSFKKAHEFLMDLIHRVRPFAQKEAEELKKFAQETFSLPDFSLWDVSFLSEKLKESRFSFTEEEVRDFFPEKQVLKGLFGTVKKLYQIDFIEKKQSVWEKSVRFFELQKNGEVVGFLYLDLFARKEKQPGAWMNELRTRERLANGKIILPVALIVGNFNQEEGETFLRLDEIHTLFHEMGHALNHLLSQVDEISASGIRRVEWDAVELPSQFMENFCWDFKVLQEMSCHRKTKEPLPQALFHKILAAKNFHSALAFMRQLELALFDLLLHAEFDAEKEEVPTLLKTVRAQCAVLPYVEWNYLAHSFSHIFAGGYAAGYFSYKWAEVLSADAFAAFEETGDIFDSSTAKRFLDEILSRGGSRLALESFLAFRGRAPTLEALLRHNAIEGNPQCF